MRISDPGPLDPARRVIDLSEPMPTLDPDASQFVTMLRRIGENYRRDYSWWQRFRWRVLSRLFERFGFVSPPFRRIEWIEDDFQPRADTLAADLTPRSRILRPEHPERFGQHDLVRIMSSGENVWITGSERLMMGRGYGRVAPSAAKRGDALLIIGAIPFRPPRPTRPTIGADAP